MNIVRFVGFLVEGLDLCVKNDRKMFYKGTVETERQSGAVDRLPVIIPEMRVKGELSEYTGSLVEGKGEIKSKNLPNGKVQLYILLDELTIVEGKERYNEVEIDGFICKEPRYRITPNGYEVCDLLLAIENRNGKSSYVPAIAWKDNALYSSQAETGSLVHVKARWQSREYIKRCTGEIRTTYELSVSDIEEVEE